MIDYHMLIEANLLAVLAEVRGQPSIGKDFPSEQLSFVDEVEQIVSGGMNLATTSELDSFRKVAGEPKRR